jgi:hypothetical protein
MDAGVMAIADVDVTVLIAVIPAHAGTQASISRQVESWVPAFAGMTA